MEVEPVHASLFFRPTSIQAENTTVRFLGYINYLGKSRVVHIILILSLRGQYFLNPVTIGAYHFRRQIDSCRGTKETAADSEKPGIACLRATKLVVETTH